MWSGLASVGVIFLIFAAGFFFHYKKIWPEGAPGAFSIVVVRLSAPCLAVTSIVAGYDREMLASSLALMLIAVLHIIILFALGKASSRMLRLGGGRKTVYEVSFTFSNVIFIGLPINQIVFGESGGPFLFAYYIITLACFWSFGVHRIASASARRGKPAISAAKILNPGFVGVLVGYGLVQAGLGLPAVLDTALGYLAGLTVPLSLLVIGANLTIFAKGIPRVAKDEVAIMLAKFVVSPLVMLGLLKIFGVAGLPFYVFLLSSSMPCHMQASILAQHYGVEPAYASRLVGLTTLLSIITIPCYVALIHAMMG
ncbi:MAG: AEC family transporter [Clostridiales Family XIII bacterium]|jgi:predicted permease|nr:AEC family transporter [Clostridiales Family XIII bacterium]